MASAGRCILAGILIDIEGLEISCIDDCKIDYELKEYLGMTAHLHLRKRCRLSAPPGFGKTSCLLANCQAMDRSSLNNYHQPD